MKNEVVERILALSEELITSVDDSDGDEAKKKKDKYCKEKLHSLLLSEEFTGKKIEGTGGTKYRLSFFSEPIEISSDYYERLIPRQVLNNRKSVQYFKKDYKEKGMTILDYIEKGILWMYEIDKLAGEWSDSLKNDPRNKVYRKQIFEKIRFKIYCGGLIEMREDSIYFYNLGGLEVDSLLMIESLHSFFDEEKENCFDSEKNPYFLLYLRTILEKRQKTVWTEKMKEMERGGLKDVRVERSDKGKKRGKNREENREDSEIESNERKGVPRIVYLSERVGGGEEGDGVELLDTLVDEKEDIEKSYIRKKVNHLRDILNTFFHLLEENKKKSDLKKKKLYYAAFTHNIIAIGEVEKIKRIFLHPNLISTSRILLELEDLIWKRLVIPYVIWLKSGEEKDYQSLLEVLKKDVSKEGIDFTKKISLANMMKDYFDKELGSKSTIDKYVEQYNEFWKSLIKYII